MPRQIIKGLFFDWYAASVPSSRSWLTMVAKMAFHHGVWEICRAKNGYAFGENLVNPDGSIIFTVFYGGETQGSNLFCFATGEASEGFASFIRSACPEHLLVRADVALDFDESCSWIPLYSMGVAAGEELKLKLSYQGPAEKERSMHTKEGRTLYVGSRHSVSMLRIYEKGKKDCKTRPDWVRVEMEFKPKNRKAREYYARASHLEILRATKAGRYVASVFASDDYLLPPVSPGTIRVDTDVEKAYLHLKYQYGNTLKHMLEHRFGGDVAAMGLDLVSDDSKEAV